MSRVKLKAKGRRPLTIRETMIATIGPVPSWAQSVGRPGLVAAWAKWDRAHGLRWRFEHDVLSEGDKRRLREPGLRDELLSGPAAPDPPGLDLIA